MTTTNQGDRPTRLGYAHGLLTRMQAWGVTLRDMTEALSYAGTDDLLANTADFIGEVLRGEVSYKLELCGLAEQAAQAKGLAETCEQAAWRFRQGTDPEGRLCPETFEDLTRPGLPATQLAMDLYMDLRRRGNEWYMALSTAVDGKEVTL